jgi:CheY-like chemotaxis protein
MLMGPRLESRLAQRQPLGGLVVAHVQKPVLQAELRVVMLEHLRWNSSDTDRPPQTEGNIADSRESIWALEREQPPSSRGTVLVVDDNAVNRVLAKKVVERLGYGADVVENGQEAVDAIQSKTYVAVLMDCMMPVMDGYTATAFIRGCEDRDGKRRLPIIGLTADAVIGARERALSAGMDDYVTKPIRTDDIKVALSRWCGMD